MFQIQELKILKSMSFDEAVRLSQKVEHVCREEKVQFTSEFQVLDNDDKVYYKGTFNFGSYDFPNIYHKIKNMANRIKVNKQHQADKLYLLEQIENLTPVEYKKEEKIDKLLINLDRNRVSKLKKWQRKTVYTFGAVGITGFLISGFLFFVQKDSYENALSEGRNQLTQSQELTEKYEVALLGNNAKMISSLESLDKEKLTENQLQILFYEYINKNEFDKAVALFDGDYIQAETMIMTSTISNEQKANKIKAFNDDYPTNEAKYDLAYIEGNWELMLNIKNVTMNVKRSEMKTYALMKVGKVDEAKLELNNNSNEKISEKITKYEVITAEIKTLEEKHNLFVKEKNTDEAKKIEKQLTTKKEELKTL